MRLSFILPFVPTRPAQVLPYAGLATWTGTERVWQGQGLVTEGHHVFASVAGAGFPLATGLGVSLMPFRHPFAAALDARSLALATGRPVVAGYGPGGMSLQRSLLGAPYRSQLGACREYLQIVRELLSGAVVEREGTYFRMHGQLVPFPSPPIELGFGVLRERMAELAGEIADVAITWLTNPEYVGGVLRPALARGAERAAPAARPAPRCRTIAMVPMAIEHPDRDPVALVLAGNRGHLSAPHYQDMLRASGIPVTGTDLERDAKEVLHGDAFVYGDPDHIADVATRYAAAGVDELVVNVTGVAQTYGSPAATRELSTLLTTLLTTLNGALP